MNVVFSRFIEVSHSKEAQYFSVPDKVFFILYFIIYFSHPDSKAKKFAQLVNLLWLVFVFFFSFYFGNA